MNVLFSTYTDPLYMPPLRLSERQVTVGPSFPDDVQGGAARSLNVPLGAYDLAELVARLPADQKPELTVVQTDAFENCKPTNLAAVPGPKLLLVADTHHGEGALAKVIDYARSEPFDRIALIHDPHHLHWFLEAGFADARYIANPNVQDFGLPFQEARRPVVAFVGQAGPQHPRRSFMLEVVRSAGLPLAARTARPIEAAQTYAQAQISFNCSLNGDLNMRVFEVLAAGGFLVTDRLSPQAGLEAFFQPGQHYVAYDNDVDLVEKLRFYLPRPELCLKIARAGQAAYRAAHTPAHRRAQVLEHARGGPVSKPHDARAAAIQCFGETLAERIRLYETLQILSLERERFVVAADSPIGARAVSDLVDLRPLAITVRAGLGEQEPLRRALTALGVERQVLIGDEPMGWSLLIQDGRAMRPFDLGRADSRALVAILNSQHVTPEDRSIFERQGLSPIGGRDWLYGRRA